MLIDVTVSPAICPAPQRPVTPAPDVAPAASAPQGPATLTVNPAPGSRNVDPSTPIAVTASTGVLVAVQMVNETGKVIDGVLTPDQKMWKPAVPLGYGRTYTLTTTGRGTDTTTTTWTTSFSTVMPARQSAVRLTTTADTPLRDGGIYGVGTVVVARFDQAIPDRAAAQRSLRISTNPPLDGAWNWVDNQTAHWRPQHYYPPGTNITVTASLYGTALGEGLYGQEDAQVSFRIGDAHIAIADDATKQVTVYNNGELVRTMPTSMGMGGSQTIGGRTFSFWTQPGVYTVMDQANPVIMDSSTYGLPINSRLGYRETISYATRISPDGIYLHQLDATVWAQGNTNVSHGCLNLNAANARWFYQFSQPGDIVEVRNTGGAPLTIDQNGDWSVPWDLWLAGSAQR
ncbi:L,D-transpeptidase [Mycobacterium asiaticum]|uniref:L,D-transpeptidase n=1 Tax=Mycobacterium asiaticum TaxID=1790 RepID=UPI0009BFD0EE|nr:Ig-like domain-containing protein [Mycobacterium asiaticum]